MSTPHAYVAVTNDLNQDQRMHRICGTLIEAGFHVTLIGRTKSDSDPLYTQKFDQHRLNMLFQKGMLFYFEYQIRLFFYLILASSPKLLYSVDLDTALSVRVAAKLRRSNTIHDAHELFTEVPELIKSPIKRSIWSTIGRLTMKGFDYRFTVNESLAKILGKTYGCEFISIRNLPIAKQKSTANLEFVKPFIWYQGVLNEGRGLEQMIEAMATIQNLDLRIAGEGDRSITLRLMAEKSIAQDRIHFHGWMKSDEMHDWASNAWLGINLLNDKSGNYYHSLANRTFDYVQAELPALHMDFPEYQEVVEEHGVGELLSDFSSDSIVNFIASLQQDKERYGRLKQSCLSAKKQLTWGIESEVMLAIIRSSKWA